MNLEPLNPPIVSTSYLELVPLAQKPEEEVAEMAGGKFINWKGVNESLDTDYSLSSSGRLIHKITHLSLGVTPLEFRRLIIKSTELMISQSTKMIGFRFRDVKYIARNNNKSLGIFRLDSIIDRTPKNLIYSVTLLSTGNKYIFKYARICGGERARNNIANEAAIVNKIHSFGPVLGIISRPYMIVDFNAFVKDRVFRNFGVIVEKYQSNYQCVLKQRNNSSTPMNFKFWECYQLLAALKSMADMNICHLDIKPDNILVKKSKTGILFIYLSDFGSAFQYQKNADNISKEFNYSCKYVRKGEIERASLLLHVGAMEQFVQLGKKIDVLSTGLILYRQFTAESPPCMFNISSPVSKSYYDPLKKAVPQPLYELIIKMLSFSDIARISADTAFKLFDKYLKEHEPIVHANIQEFVQKNKFVNIQNMAAEKLEVI